MLKNHNKLEQLKKKKKKYTRRRIRLIDLLEWKFTRKLYENRNSSRKHIIIKIPQIVVRNTIVNGIKSTSK